MLVTVNQTASLLGISASRVRHLLFQGRIEGAFKVDRGWFIPLREGMPVIRKGKRGQEPRWKCAKSSAVKTIHVNTQAIKRNQKNKATDPVITVKTYKSNNYCHEVIINGPSRLIYQPFSRCSSPKVILQTFSEVEIKTFDYNNDRLQNRLFI